MLFSIIIPVYKTEKYLHKCISSIINQNFSNYEIILIDDGSPDNSGAICDDYALKYNNVKVIHQDNKGVSSARNRGIIESKGEYILFLDSDDKLNNGSLEFFNYIIQKNNSDIVISSYSINNNINIIEQTIINKETKKTNNDNIKLLEYAFINTHINIWQVWGKAYKSNIIKNNNLLFDEKIPAAEDCDFFIRAVLKSKNLYFANFNTVEYMINRIDSISYNMNFYAVKGQLQIFHKWNNFFVNKSLILSSFFMEKYLNSLSNIYRVKNKENRNTLFEYIKGNKIDYHCIKGKKYKLTYLILKLFGIKIGCYFLYLYHKIKIRKDLRKND